MFKVARASGGMGEKGESEGHGMGRADGERRVMGEWGRGVMGGVVG